MKTDLTHRKNVEAYARRIENIYLAAVQEAALIAASVQHFDIFDPEKPFTFAQYPLTKHRIDNLTSSLLKNVQTVVLNGTEHEWTLANNKNNELTRRVFGDNLYKLTSQQQQRYFSNNHAALTAFQKRKTSGLDLSDRVWRYTDQFKAEIEMSIDLALRDRLPAAEMALELRNYLQQPDKLFRRVRDEHGQLHLSKRAAAYHPGAGVYRSSVRNAQRLARTEINMAYRTSDHQRWQDMDFVVGFEVRRSNNLSCHCPLCESLKGKYPKAFKFTGWHPQCRCYAVPILKTVEEFLNNSTNSKNAVTETPENFKAWVRDNQDRIERARSKPYFLTDNKGFYVEKLTIEDIKNAIKVDNGTTTEDIFRKTEGYNSKRSELHADIVNKYIGNSSVKSDTVYMLGGAPANGKSTLVNAGLLPHPKGALVIDADNIKSMIPEYKLMVSSGNKEIVKAAANFVHEESSFLGKRIQSNAFAKNIATIIDGVNDGSFEKVYTRVADIKKATGGKRIRADYVSLDTDLSIKLAKIRAEKTGREVPLPFVIKNNKEISKLIPELIKNNTFDELYLWDTNIEGKPRLILKMIDGKLTMKDEILYNKFLGKAN